MTTYTAVKDWTAAVLTSADMDTYVSGNTAYLKAWLHPDAAALLTVASGIVTITQTCHKIEGEGTTDDELVTVSGGAEGKILILRANSASIITLKDASGNLKLGRDIVLDSVTKYVILISNGTNWYPFVGPSTVRHANAMEIIDLSGSAAASVILHPTQACTMAKLTFVYVEASSGDAGITVTVGKEFDTAYYYTGTSEISKAQFYEKDCVLLANDIAAGDTVLFNSAGGKVGTGAILACIEYEVN